MEKPMSKDKKVLRLFHDGYDVSKISSRLKMDYNTVCRTVVKSVNNMNVKVV